VRVCLLSCWIVLLSPLAFATRDAPTHRVERATSPIQVDGALDEPAWDHAVRIELGYEVQPAENITPPVRTVCLVTYDENYTYFGFLAYDPDPGDIRARFSDRDRAWDDDRVGIVLDTFNDERRAYELYATPLGIQIDAVRDDVRGNYDSSWNAIWDSAGRITDEGYEVEIAIPFSQIRFQDTEGIQTWGFDAVRQYPRDQQHQIGSFPRDRGNNSYLGQAIKLVGMAGARPGNNLEIVPTLTGSRTDVEATAGTGDLERGDPDGDLGLTVRWGVTPNMSLSGALNPDFSNIEADALKLDVNQQFALFFRETRPFFLEGADYFDSGLRLVHTRSVADPSSALKLTGKTGRHTFGIFGAQDDVTNIIVPGSQSSSSDSFAFENTSVAARYSYDLGKNSTVGTTMTDRRGSGYTNSVASVDTVYRFNDQDSLSASVALSATEYNDEIVTTLGVAPGSMSDTGYNVNYGHGERGWWINADYDDFGDDFRSDLGFRTSVGRRSLNLSGAKVWWGDPGDYRNRTAWGGSVTRSELQDGSVLKEELASWFNFRGPRNSRFSVRAETAERQFDNVLFDVWELSVDYQAQATADISVNLHGETGDWIDFANTQPAERLTLRPSFRYNIGRHVNVWLRHTYTQLDVNGGRLFSVHAPELRTVHQFNPRAFIRLVLQYTDIERDPTLYVDPVDAEQQTLLSQLLFSYKINPQTAAYAGYTDNRLGTDVDDLARTDRTFFVKFGYAWLR